MSDNLSEDIARRTIEKFGLQLLGDPVQGYQVHQVVSSISVIAIDLRTPVEVLQWLESNLPGRVPPEVREYMDSAMDLLIRVAREGTS